MVIYLFTVEIYLSPVETHCSNVDYYIPDENNETKGFSDDAMNRYYFTSTAILLITILTLIKNKLNIKLTCFQVLWKYAHSKYTLTSTFQS